MKWYEKAILEKRGAHHKTGGALPGLVDRKIEMPADGMGETPVSLCNKGMEWIAVSETSASFVSLKSQIEQWSFCLAVCDCMSPE